MYLYISLSLAFHLIQTCYHCLCHLVAFIIGNGHKQHLICLKTQLILKRIVYIEI